MRSDSPIACQGALHSSCFGPASTSRQSANPGGSAGHLCLGSPIGRLVGGSVLVTGSAGTLREAVDLDVIPQPTGAVAVQAGETWHFQLWFRDSNGGVPTSNFTDGLRVVFL